MRVFVSYAAEQRRIAERVYLALVADGHEVFFDRTALQAAAESSTAIRDQVAASNLLVFLVSRDSLAAGTAALTELALAQVQWPHPAHHVLPVRVDDVPFDVIPEYLKAVSLLQPAGDVAAEVAACVQGMRPRWNRAMAPALIAAWTVLVFGPVAASFVRPGATVAIEMTARTLRFTTAGDPRQPLLADVALSSAILFAFGSARITGVAAGVLGASLERAASMTLKPVHLETLFVPAGSDVLLDVEPEEPGSVRIGISGNTPAQATFRLPAGGSITCPACGDEIGMGSFRTRAASGAAVSVVGTKATQVQLDCSECPGTPLPDRPVPVRGRISTDNRGDGELVSTITNGHVRLLATGASRAIEDGSRLRIVVEGDNGRLARLTQAKDGIRGAVRGAREPVGAAAGRFADRSPADAARGWVPPGRMAVLRVRGGCVRSHRRPDGEAPAVTTRTGSRAGRRERARAWVALTCGVLALAPAPSRGVPQPAQRMHDWHEVTDRVVKIQSTFRSGRSETGAGLIVGTQQDDLVVATASHVAFGAGEAGTPDSAERIGVFAYGDRVRAHDEVTAADANPEVDLALLRVRAADLALRYSELPLLCWREPSADEAVTTIGHPAEEWQVNSIDSVLLLKLEVDTRRFVVSSQAPDRGSSGGPVLGQDGCLLGFIVSKMARETRVTRVREIMALAQARGFSVDLLGGDTPLDHARRQQAFDEIARALNAYAFDLQAVQAIFRRELMAGDELARTIEAYNKSYRQLYDGRDGYSQTVTNWWGRQRGREWSDLVAVLDDAHKKMWYSKLNDVVAGLRAHGKLNRSERKRLEAALPLLDSAVDTTTTRITRFVGKLRPLATPDL